MKPAPQLPSSFPQIIQRAHRRTVVLCGTLNVAHRPCDAHQNGAVALTLAGNLLISPPMMEDPNFAGSVVAVLVHQRDGAFGLVLNHPIDVELTTVTPDWAERAASPRRLFQGGPVQTDALIAVGRATSGRATELPVGLVSLDLQRLPVDEALEVDDVRVFAGYSGWAPGQLDDEVAMGGWLVVAMEADDVFCGDPDVLWQRVLRRQGGEVAWLSLHPDDVGLN